MIYMASDIHGHIRLDWLKNKLDNIDLSTDDYLLILGDAGIVWSNTEHLEVASFYNSLACKTLFIDGNHENFTLLNAHHVIKEFGGSVHQISSKIYHLMRGEVYTIEGRTFWVFGGGFSLKKPTNNSPVFVWDEEMPNDAEYKNGITNLSKHGNSVDYILTHVTPISIAKKYGIPIVKEEKELNEYLEKASQKVNYKHWFFGHYHMDFDGNLHSCIYKRIVRIGE